MIIAVNIGLLLLNWDQLTSAVAASSQMLRVLGEGNARDSLCELRLEDLRTIPRLTGIASSDYDKLRESMQHDQSGARAMASRLAAYSLTAVDQTALGAARFASRRGNPARSCYLECTWPRYVRARQSHLEFDVVAGNDHVRERNLGHDGYGQKANPRDYSPELKTRTSLNARRPVPRSQKS